jgi:hypothetical protein
MKLLRISARKKGKRTAENSARGKELIVCGQQCK